jgi:stearoyl-CoA desaturase (delta-9 desaturase)
MMMIILMTLLMTHLTIVSVTLYLHRCQAHRGVEFHPVLTHMMRFWLWMTTGMTTKQWVAVHRKHHQTTDVEGDPHSPHVFGIKTVMTTGWLLYNTACKDADFVMKYGAGTPKDWIERKLYQPHHKIGILLMLAIDLALFGPWGLLVWGVQMIWIPFWAAGMINGLAHWWGYRNGETKDFSRNISPIGIIVGGEELHNSHHLDPASPKFSQKWWEFDIGWMYICILRFFGLAKLRTDN